MELVEIIAEQLRKALEARVLSQRQFAKILDVPQGTISSYCIGRSYPSVQMLVRMCDALGVSADYLLGRVD